jgi:hypothetical protein
MEENLSLSLNPYLDPTSKPSFKNLENQVIFYDKNNFKNSQKKPPSLCLDPCLDLNSNLGLKTLERGIIIGTKSSLKD